MKLTFEEAINAWSGELSGLYDELLFRLKSVGVELSKPVRDAVLESLAWEVYRLDQFKNGIEVLVHGTITNDQSFRAQGIVRENILAYSQIENDLASV